MIEIGRLGQGGLACERGEVAVAQFDRNRARAQIRLRADAGPTPSLNSSSVARSRLASRTSLTNVISWLICLATRSLFDGRIIDAVRAADEIICAVLAQPIGQHIRSSLRDLPDRFDAERS